MSSEEIIEEDVQEVRCSVTGVPLPSIPAWYAGVRVNFISDAVRQRSTRATEVPAAVAASPVVETSARSSSSLLAGDEDGADPALLEEADIETDDIVDEVDVDLDDAEPLEAEAEEER